MGDFRENAPAPASEATFIRYSGGRVDLKICEILTSAAITFTYLRLILPLGAVSCVGAGRGRLFIFDGSNKRERKPMLGTIANASRRITASYSAKFGVILVGAAAAQLLHTPVAHAVPLAVGAEILSVGEPDPTSGSTIADSGLIGFSKGSLTGTLRTIVINGDASNPFGLSALTFLYQVSNTGTALQDSMERLTINGYTGYATDVSYQVPTVGIAPGSFTRDSDANGDVVGFNFSQLVGFGKVAPGQTSSLLVVQTNSTTFQVNAAAVIDGTAISPIFTYAPTASIPEPGTFLLSALGALGVAFFTRRARRA